MPTQPAAEAEHYGRIVFSFFDQLDQLLQVLAGAGTLLFAVHPSAAVSL
jgi:hypothetical protein